ncbi:hypothetical protein [Breznakiella homolactica]|uniref:Uncharacterized protein n=1 Tax=Breznakiella homolactica TaxID=2798577 RepID=A0A7T7XJK0_9SPIR|nr:hypothetical protein [Breznakiella homolactica]QQO07392.1 hypothetical protein JFL75_10490 [Breznakiella homolactica]
MFLPVLAIACAGLVYFARAPLLVVEDAYFTSLYGADRTRMSRIRASLTLFRPVRSVVLVDTLGPDGIAFAVSEASSQPYAVFFPYRYRAGAERYADQQTGTAVAVFAGTQQPEPPLNDRIRYFITDRTADMYRSGLAAAILSENSPDRVVCCLSNSADGRFRDAFLRGLRDGGHNQDPIYVDPDADYPYSESFAAAVIADPTDRFFQKKNPAPTVLHSWINPELTNSQVKIIFDDAPWALLAGGVRNLSGRVGTVYLPSKAAVMDRRLAGGTVKRSLQAAAGANFTAE